MYTYECLWGCMGVVCMCIVCAFAAIAKRYLLTESNNGDVIGVQNIILYVVFTSLSFQNKGQLFKWVVLFY